MRLLLGIAILCASVGVQAQVNVCERLFQKTPVLIKQTRSDLTPKEKVDAINNDRYDSAYDGKIRAEYLPEFKTIRQFSVSGRLPSDAKVRVLLTHGSGAIYSHSDAMRGLLRWLGEDKGLAKPSSNTSRLREYENFTKVAIEAIDLPFHGQGSRDPSLREKQAVTDYLIRYLKQMKAETPDLPLVVFGRSSSPSLFIEILTLEPGLIDGVIDMSPVVPLTKEIVKDGTSKAIEMAEKGEFAIYPEGLEWIDHLLLNTKWDDQSLNGKPALFLTGNDDWEVSTPEREYMVRMESTHSNVKYIDIPGAGHDVFRETKINNDKQVLSTLKSVEDFLSYMARQ